MLKAIIFDFDGVIADTYQINFDLFKYFDDSFSEEDFIDHHSRNVFDEPKIKLTEEDISKYFEMQKKIFSRSHLFPLSDSIIELSKNYQLFIVSSTNDENIHHYLKLGKIEKFFKKVLGATTHTSKVEKFRMIFREFNLTGSDCVFITDTIGDIKEAGEVGLATIAVTWGYHSKELLQTHNPTLIIENISELVGAVDKVANNET